jgi:hypothetical protein
MIYELESIGIFGILVFNTFFDYGRVEPENLKFPNKTQEMMYIYVLSMYVSGLRGIQKPTHNT